MKEVEFKLLTAGLTTYLWGGWSILLDLLVFLVIADYVSGVVAAYKEKKLSSMIGFVGLAKKVLLFLMVATAHKMDLALNLSGLLKNAVIWFYIANEGLSLTENAARLNLPVPVALKDALKQLKRKSEEREVKNNDRSA